MIPSVERIAELRGALLREADGLRRAVDSFRARSSDAVLAKLRAKAHDWDEVAGILADVAAERGNALHRGRRPRAKGGADGRGIVG